MNPLALGPPVLALALCACGTQSHGQPPGATQDQNLRVGLPAANSQGVIEYAKGFTSAPAGDAAVPEFSNSAVQAVAQKRVDQDPARFPADYTISLREVTKGNTDEPGIPKDTWVITFPRSQPIVLGPSTLTAKDLADMRTAYCEELVMLDATTGSQVAELQLCGATAEGRAQLAKGISASPG